MLLKKACLAVGLKKVADDYLRHSYFTDFVLSQDLSKMQLLMRIADNGDPDLTRVFFNIARVLNGKVTSYEMLDYPSKEKAFSRGWRGSRRRRSTKPAGFGIIPARLWASG